jgi:transcriptional regulator with XRE-family HTH domain
MPNPHDEITIGSMLRRLRLNSGVSQEALAAAVGIPQTIVSRIERGTRRITASELRLACEMLGVSMADFAAEFEEKAREEKARIV